MSEPKFPQHIMRRLRERQGLEPNDTSCDDVIASYTGLTAVRECVTWELGSGSWFDTIAGWIESCGGKIEWSDQ